MKISDLLNENKFEYTTEKQILIRIRQILYDRKLSGTESNSAELSMLKRKLKDIRNKQSNTETLTKVQKLLETRKSAYQYLKNLLPKWPDYVVKDLLYANLVRGPTTGGDKDLQQNQNTARSKMFRYQYADQMNKMAASGKTGRQLPKDYAPPFEPNTDLKGTLLAKQNQSDPPIKNDYTFKTIKQDVQSLLTDAGLTADTKWQLIPDLKFTMDMWDPLTLKKLKERAGGTKNPFEVPRDAERHDTQAQLAKQQGGVRKEPVILIKHNNGYELLEGWHRTIQHFKQFPQGYVGPAWVAIAQDNVIENFADGKGPGRPGDSQRHGIPKKATMAQLEKAAKAKGRKGQLARWQINMRRGKKKANEQELLEGDNTVFIYDRAVELLFNPGYQRMLAFAKQSEYQQLRALYVPSEDIVVVWKAEQGIHHSIATALIEQLGWDLGPDYANRMMRRQLNDPMHPISAILTVSKPLVDQTGKRMRDTNLHRRAGNFSVTAFPQFYKTAWWERISRTAPVIEAWTKKYKKSINCNNPKGFSQRAHCAGRKKRQAGGKTKSQSIREDISAPQKDLAKNLIKLSQEVSLSPMPTVQGTKTYIVDLDDRPIVLVNFNGHKIPFYCSTGMGGKADVASGKWYPFWGIGSDGWFNKGSTDMINNFYYSKKLATVAAKLNQYLGNLVRYPGIPQAGTSAEAAINQNQHPLSQVDARKDLIKYYAGITSQIRTIG